MTPINTQLPTLALDEHGNWELILPADVLPAFIANITVSNDGIYVETNDGEYDLISYTDLEDLIVPGRGRVIAGRNGHSGWPAPQYLFVEDGAGVIPLH